MGRNIDFIFHLKMAGHKNAERLTGASEGTNPSPAKPAERSPSQNKEAGKGNS